MKIPKHWKIHRLKEVADARPSNVDKKTVDGDTPVLLCNYVDVYKNRTIKADMEFMEATATRSQVEQFSIRAGDVIITKDSEAWDDIGVPAHVPEAVANLVCGYHLTLVRPNPKVLHGAYLARCFESEGLRDQFCVAANGVTRYGLGTQEIKCFVLPVPPLPEQQAIAAFLDRETAGIDALIARKKRLIELLEEKCQAVVSNAVTNGIDNTVKTRDSGTPWLGFIPEHWEIKPIKHCTTILGGMTPSKVVPEYWNGSVPWVSAKDMKRFEISDSEDHITESALNETSITLLPKHTVMLVIRGMILAKHVPVAINKVPVTINQDMKGLVCHSGLLPQYLGYQLRSIQDAFFAVMEEAGHGTLCLRTELWNRILIAIPSVAEQQAICKRIDRATASITECIRKIDVSLNRLLEYRTALISAAVTGQIDVRDEVELDG
ncbi:MAG: restriction endonuclease subunit S [Pirellulales bacterium]